MSGRVATSLRAALSRAFRANVNNTTTRSFLAPVAVHTGPRRFSGTAPETKGENEQAAKVKAELEDLLKDKDFNEEAAFTAQVDEKAPTQTEVVKGKSQQMSFQAETRQLLDIVAKSLYTDKEVFLRELISNASDALEKARYLQSTNQELRDSDRPFEIQLFSDEAANTLTIQDFGVGMTQAELIENLGTIARSGSKAFVKELREQGSGSQASNIIGQFGVGFYSTFMVADKVEVFSKSGPTGRDGVGHHWVSTGAGTYEVSEAEGTLRGTKIILHLRPDCKQFSIRSSLELIVKKYSNFVGFPIFLNNKKVNTVEAIWTQDRDTASEEQHLEFYRYIANAYDAPLYRLKYKTDAPLAINALFYLPERHMEKYGMGRLEPGVSLYSRKVLIQAKCKAILPDWARFVKGVVDSEDIPLNISRENMQDSALLNKMNSVLTKRLIKFLAEQSRTEPEKYLKFYEEFSSFIKEGVCTDFLNKNELAKLVRYETSETEANKLSTFDDYIGRMRPGDTSIFYLCAPSRDFAMTSPYLEAFKKKNIEVLLLYSGIDEFVMQNLGEFNKRRIVSIESADANQAVEQPDKDKQGGDAEATPEAKQEEAAFEARLTAYVQEVLQDRVSSVKSSTRLTSSPAIIVDHESASVRRMMAMVNQTNSATRSLAKQKLEVNPKHQIMQGVMALKDAKPDVARLVLEQVFDNALIAADILDNPRTMITRLNSLLEQALKNK